MINSLGTASAQDKHIKKQISMNEKMEDSLARRLPVVQKLEARRLDIS